MNFMHVVEPRRLSGGLCMFWKDAHQVVLVKYAGFLIEVGVHDALMNHTWRFLAVYASTDAGVRRNQLGVLQERLNTCREGCLVMGDFNDILDASEKDGGRPRSVPSMEDFRRFVTYCNLLDLGFEGYPFTWRNRRDDGGI
ncbi:PREDICTED: reverse mRNAase [Prunus dulcis]|uniref:PREDICTED: reverse mRNAase n=1 Tax=Prunus dulcis TaxID=3755 RepID=A0A5E4EWF1_PRUDU|nr:PREDICTED: reverse mRNAase [Prunus dulcis]